MTNEQIAIVTGAGSGIGKAIAEKFLSEGWSVVAADKDANGLDRLSSGPRRDRIAALEVDVTTEDASERLFSTCTAAFGAPTCLVNNAGKGNAKHIFDTSDEDFDFYLDLNLRSVFRSCRTAGAAMQPGSAIVNIASVFGMTGFRGSSPYSAAKAGVIGLTRQLAAEFGPRGIRVNAVAPGVIVTPATEERVRTNAWLNRAMVMTAPLGRPGKPEEVAEAVFFLGSDAARYISGVVLPVDGGWTGTRFYPDL